MGTVRKRHGTKLKADVALEAMKGEKTVAEIASKFRVSIMKNEWTDNHSLMEPDESPFLYRHKYQYGLYLFLTYKI